MSRAIGKLERLAYERQLRDLRNPPSYLDDAGVEQRYRFSWATGNRAVKFFEGYLCHHKGEWARKPFKLQKWQKFTLRTVFGWLRADGTRRFRTDYEEVARKNGKSEKAAGTGLFLVAADGEEGAEVYSSATKKEQAKIVWNSAAKMVRASPELARFVQVTAGAIMVRRTGSTFQPLGANSKTLDGINPHGNIIDELHAHKDRGVWDVLDSALGARRQPMTVVITTAGRYDPEGIGYQQHEYAVSVLEGVIADETFFAFIACADEDDLKGSEKFSDVALQKANPNWGVSAKVSYLRGQATKAKIQTGFLPEYEAKHINVWSQQAKRWLQMDRWALCEPEVELGVDQRALAAVREQTLEGLACRAGLDLSSKIDLSSLVIEFELEGDAVALVARFWLPEAKVAEEAARGRRHYENWVREGWLVATPGEVVDYDFIRADIVKLSKLYQLQEIGFDPYKATQLVTQLREGDGIQMVEVRQGHLMMAAPCDDIEGKVVAKQVRHMNNPIMRWCAANCIVTLDPAGNKKPDKANSRGKIDGIVAWAMARSRNIVNGEKKSAYEDRGFLSL